MLNFILRRLGQSLLVILGVMLLTFVLFQMAAGDPAAAVLSKNPKPLEIENMRRELKSDLPMFYGHWRKSEVYAAADYSSGKKELADVILEGDVFAGNGVLDVTGGSVTFNRRFEVDEKVLCRVTFSGMGTLNGRDLRDSCGGDCADDSLESADFIIEDNPDKIIIAGGDDHGLRLKNVEFFRYQDNAFNSQFINSLREVADIKETFPYVSFLNFGKTVTTREPINDIIARGIWPSLSVMLPVFVFELLLGIALALIAVACKDTLVDRALLVMSVAGMSISYLVLIIFGQWFLGYYLNLFPVWGWGSLRYLVLPVLLGVISGLGGGVRFYRTVFVNELKSEYLRTALAKGCSKPKVYVKHLLRNAMIPIIARASALLPFIFTGSLLLESFFGIPGLGCASIDALNNSDLALLKALTIVNALLFVVINLLADLLCAWMDPRIRLE
ncbi:MAG: ABC transporter permease [Lentisphaerae bacterium]|nr:ABC transporter permease [Lentisphaerota bacterium]